MKRRNKVNWFIIVFIIVLFFPLVGFFIPIKFDKNSIYDNRVMNINKNSILNGTLKSEVESYFNSKISFHNQMVWLKTNIDLFSGRRETNGVYITDKMLIKKPQLPNNENCIRISNYINTISNKSQKKTYAMFFPTSAQINKSLLPDIVPQTDEISLIGYLNKMLSKNITVLDGVTPLSSNKGNNSYYSTDSRISSYGAYLLYNYNIKQLGFSPVPLKDFNIEYSKKDFYGNLYAKTYYTGISPDKINLYHYNSDDIKVKVKSFNKDRVYEREGLFETEKLNETNSIYALAGDEADVKVIETNSDSNKKIVVFADENFDPLLQFLILHYQKITVISTKQLNQNISNLINMNDDYEILFSYSIESMASNEYIENVGNLLF